MRRESAAQGPSRRPGSLAAAGILALVCLAAYWNSFRAELLLDNQTIILQDPRLRTAAWQNVEDIFTHHYWWPSLESHLYRPLTTLTYWVDYAVLGHRESPAGYHAVNLLLHWVNAVFAFLLVRSTTGRSMAALAAAAVFASHPLTVESVTNIVGQADLLAAMSVMAAFCSTGDSSGPRAGAARRISRAWCGLPRRRVRQGERGRAARHHAAARCRVPARERSDETGGRQAVVGECLAGLSRHAAGPGRAAVGPVDPVPRLTALRPVRLRQSHCHRPLVDRCDDGRESNRLLPGSHGLAARLSCDYSYNAITLAGWTLASGQDPHAWAALAVVVGLAAVAAVAWRRDRAVAFFLGFAAAAFLPTSNLLFDRRDHGRAADVPAAGWHDGCDGAGCRLRRGRASDALPEGRRRAAGIAAGMAIALVVGALIARTVVRNEDWTSGRRLWSASAEAAPGSIKVHRAMAALAMNPIRPVGGRRGAGHRHARVAPPQADPLPLHHRPAALYGEIAAYQSTRHGFAARGEQAQARAALGEAVSMLGAPWIVRINRQGAASARRLRPEDIPDSALLCSTGSREATC